MIEAVLSWIFLLIGLITRNADFLIASGCFAIAANINAIYHKKDGADNDR